MAGSRELRLVISGTDRGAGRTLDSVERKSHHLGRTLRTLGTVAAVGFGVLGVAAVRGIGRAVQGYEAHNKVVRQTTAAIRSTGGAANVSVRQVSRLSDALERKTTVDGDLIQTGANMLLTFTRVRNEVGRGNDIFTQATRTVLDMSVALGQDTKSSAIQLGKALNDPIRGVTALQRVGVTFTQQQKDQIRTLVESGRTLDAQKIILKELATEFGGSAAAAATPLGRLQVLGRQFSDTIGSIFLPAVNTLTTGLLTKFSPALSQISDQQGPRLAATLDDIAKKIVAGIPPVDQLAASAGRVATKAGELATKASTLATSLTEARTSTGDFTGATKTLSDTVRVAGVVTGFLAQHTDLLAKALPALVVVVAAYKVAQAAANVAQFAHVALLPAQIAGNIALARSNRSLAVAIAGTTAAQSAQTAAAGAATVATAASGGAAATARTRWVAFGGALAVGTAALAGAEVAARHTTETQSRWIATVLRSLGPTGALAGAFDRNASAASRQAAAVRATSAALWAAASAARAFASAPTPRVGSTGGLRSRAFQHGGVLTEPVVGFGTRTGTRYTLAERGPELVVPTGKASGSSSSGVAGGDVHVHFHGPVYGDARVLAAKVQQLIREDLRRRGMPVTV